MGAWKEGPFDNDTAHDWLWELQECSDATFLIKTLEQAYESEILDSPECEQIVAAATLVNAASFEKLSNIPKAAKDWIRKRGFVPDRALVDVSITALAMVLKNSELLNLYRESRREKPWRNATEKTLQSLQSIDINEVPARKPKGESIPRALYKLVAREDLYSNPEIRKRIKLRLQKMQNPDLATKETEDLAPVALLAKHGLYEEVLLLLEKGANINHVPDILTYACGTDSLELVELIVESGVEITQEYTLVTSPDVLVMSPGLMNAAAAGTADIVDAMVSAGADLFQVDNNGEGVLHYAARNNNHRVIQHLLELGVDVNLRNNTTHETPAHFCLKHFESLKLLLDYGADPNIQDRWEGTLLDRALIRETDDETVELLRKYGARKTKDWIEDDR